MEVGEVAEPLVTNMQAGSMNVIFSRMLVYEMKCH